VVLVRKFLWSTLVCLLLSLGTVTLTHAEKNADNQEQNQEQRQNQGQNQNQPAVQLTEAQKTELAKLHKDILEKKKEMIQKYVEFGIIPEEKGQMIITHFDKHYEMLEQNGFILRMPPHHNKGEMPEKSE
jgi:uncharacterized FlaG/YvyC family protein